MKNHLLPVCIVTILAACQSTETKPVTSASDPLFADRDTSVRPGENFFLYANGGWIKNNKIPDAEAQWGIGNLVNEEIYLRKKNINEKAVKENAAQGTISQKIADFYTTAMDSSKINKEGLTPLRSYLDSITNAASPEELLRLNAALRMRGSSSLFALRVLQDQMNSEKIVVDMEQGGLGMPDRDYYFDKDAKSEAVRQAYKKEMTQIFQKLGMDSNTSSSRMNEVYEMETHLAKSSRTISALRDPYKNYHKLTVSKLSALTPNINWNKYFSYLGINNPDSIVVGQPEFFTALNKELKTTPPEVWKNYMKFNLVADYAAYLDSDTYMTSFAFRKALYGVKEPRPRWKRVLDAEEKAMGEALGQLFVKEYFNDTAKKRYSDLVENIRAAYKERIEKLTWMSDTTKAKALEKLSSMNKKVGYPDKWKDFSAMQIGKTSFAQNMMNANLWWYSYFVNKLGKPVDRTEWGMTPQTYNAYYTPSNNEIVLPAGIFTVPGKMDAELDDAFVYGYAGASTIGHEITHGFDDQGRQYDPKGNLKNWWTTKDSAQFAQRATMIIKQFSEFTPVDTIHINGDATQGENIADLGGLLLGLDAFKKTEAYKSGKLINGLTPLQRYFLGYAYGWMIQERPETIASYIKTDVHSPSKERVNGPFVNIPEFYEAFGIKKGDKMYREDTLRVNIW